MPVSTKFYVTKIDGPNVHFGVVVRGIENREWSAATPGGDMRLYITNPDALEQFKQYDEWEFIGRQTPKPMPGDKHPVDHYEDHPAGQPDKTYHVCKTCGSYARLSPDGTPDWTGHVETFGMGLPETGDSELASQ